MLWEDRLKEWAKHPCTAALLVDVKDDIHVLSRELVMEDDPAQVRLRQGLLRANLEFLNKLENLDITEGEDYEHGNG